MKTLALNFASALAILSLAASAATLTWDADSGTAGAQDGAGTWDAVLANWWDGAADTNWSDATPDSAVIGAGSGAAGAVSIGGTRTAAGLVFHPPGSGAYTLTNGTLVLGSGGLLLAPPAPSTPALDAVSAGAQAQAIGAWSLRKLRAAYAGPAISVQRSSDSATQDIGFAASGELDTAALLAFVGASDGIVTVVYPQVGSVPMVKQRGSPKIVAGGVLQTWPNGKPRIGQTTVDGLRTSGLPNIFAGGGATVFVVLSKDNSAASRTLTGTTGNWLAFHWSNGETDMYFNGNPNYLQQNNVTIGVKSWSFAADATSMQEYRNGVQVATFNTPSLTGPGDLDVNGVGAYNEAGTSSFGEMIIFGAKLAAGDLAAVHDSQARYLYLAVGATQSVAIASAVSLGAAQTWTTGGDADLTVGGGIDNGGSLLTASIGKSATFSGPIAGTGGLTKQGEGTLTLSGSNTFVGMTTVSAGRLTLAGGSGTNTIAGDLTINPSSGWNANGVRLAAGEQIADTAVIHFTGADWSGFFPMGFAETVAGLDSPAGKGVIENSTQNQGGAGGNGRIVVHVPEGAGYTFNGTFRDNTAGDGTTVSLLKSGAGTQTLAGAVSYTGLTTVDDGVLELLNTTVFASSAITNKSTVLMRANANVAWANPSVLRGGGRWIVDGPGGGTVMENRVILRGNGSDSTSTIEVVNSGRLWLDRAVNAIGDSTIVDVGPAAQFLVFADPTPANQVAETIGGLTGSGSVYGYLGGGTVQPSLTVGGGGVSATFGGVIGDTNGSRLALTKTGSGTQTLAGASTFSGITTVNGGALALAASGSISNCSLISVSSGAAFDVTAAGLIGLGPSQGLGGGGTVRGSVIAQAGSRLAPGADAVGGAMGTLSIVGNVGLHPQSTNVFHFSGVTNAGGGFNDLVAITGDLAPSNSVVRVEPNQLLANGTYRLFTYTGGKTTSFNPAPVFPGRGKGAYVDDASEAGRVNLVVTGAYENLVWLPQSNALWTGVDANWSNTATASLDFFKDSDVVTFNQAGAYSNSVSIPGFVTPLAVTVSGASNYTFSGAGRIAGIASLTKSGSGTLLMLNTNTYAGLTVVNGGTIQVGDGGTSGALPAPGEVRVESGGTLMNFRGDHYTANLTLSRNVSGAGNWVVKGTGVSLYSDYLVTGIQTGFTGTLTIDRARFQADAVTDAGYASINVLTGGQFWAFSGATYSNAIAINGYGWQEGPLYGALRLQLGPTYAGPVTLAGYSRVGFVGSICRITGNISGPYDLEAYGFDAASQLRLSGQNTFNDLRVAAYWTYVNGGAAAGTGDVVMAGGGFAAFGNDLTLTNGLLANSTIHIGYNPVADEIRSINWMGPWDLNGAGRDVNLYNTTTVWGAIGGANGGLYKAATGPLILRGTNAFANTGWCLYTRSGLLELAGNSVSTGSGNLGLVGGSTVIVTNNAVLDLAGQIYMGNGGGHWGTINQYPGTLVRANSTDGTRVLIIGEYSGATSYYNLYGGTLLVTNGVGRTYLGWDGGGLLRIHGGLAILKTIRADGQAGGIDLDGGELRIGTGGIDNPSGPVAINLGGATLSAFENWASSVPMTLTGTNGNLAVDTRGNTIGLGGALAGAGGLNKVGTGVLALNGTYAAGPITVNGGALGGTGTVNADVTVSNGAAVQPGYLTTAGALTLSTVTFEDGSELNAFAGGDASLLLVTATDGFTVPSGAGRLVVNVLDPLLAAGTYVVVDYDGGIMGGIFTNIALGAHAPRSAMHLVENVANSSIDLVVETTAEPIKWSGQTDDQWDIGATTNWLTELGLSPTAYLQDGPIGDTVLFDDTAAGNFYVAVAEDVAPYSMVVSNEVNDYSFAGEKIAGGGTLTKRGAAKLSLLGTNSYVGATTVEAGALRLSGDSSLGEAPAGVTPGHLTIWQNTRLEAAASFAVAPTRGILLGASGQSGTVTVATGPNTLTVASALAQAAGSAIGLTKEDTGTLLLRAANHTGITTISNGTLYLDRATDFRYSSVDVAAGATLVVDAVGGIDSWNYSFNSGAYSLSGAGTIVKTGPGWFQMDYNGPGSFAGTVIVSNGVFGSAFDRANWANFRGDVTCVSNALGMGVLDLRCDPVVVDELWGGGEVWNSWSSQHQTLTVGAADGSSLFSGRIRGTALGGQNTPDGQLITLIKAGTGTLVLAGQNTYRGNTTVDNGELVIADGGKLYDGAYQPTAVASVSGNALLDLENWHYGEAVPASLGGLRDNSDAIVIDGGRIRVRSTSSYSRGFTVGSGGATLEAGVGAVWTLGLDTNNPIVSASGGSLTLTGEGDGVLAKEFPGSASLVKDGPGTWTLSASNTYSGFTTIVDGKLLVDGWVGPGPVLLAAGTLGGSGTVQGEVNCSGTLAPGTSAGRLTIGGTLAINAGSKLSVELGGTAQGTEYDVVTVLGDTTLDGDLEVTFIDGFQNSVAPGDQFTILESPSTLSGVFTNAANGATIVVSGQAFIVHYGPDSALDSTDVILEALGSASGDSDGDGLSDDDETNVYGTDPFDPDSDNDGMNDGDEVVAGSNPLNAGSTGYRITQEQKVGGAVVVRWSSTSNRTYDVLSSTNLLRTQIWTPVSTVPSGGATTSYTNASPGSAGFYQIKARLP
jgi:fibronectin-binding autotransporter adhesin